MSTESNDDHIKKLTSIQTNINTIQSQLQLLFSSSALISQFIQKESLIELSKIISAEDDYIRWNHNKSSFDPKKRKFSDDVKQYLIDNNVKFSIDLIEHAIDEAWIELFTPKPSLERQELIFNFLDEPTRAQILIQIKNIYSNFIEIPNIDGYEQLYNEQASINRELEDHRNKNSDPHFTNLMIDHKSSQDKIIEYVKQLEEFKNEKLNLTAKKTELHKQLSILGHISDTDDILHKRQITAKINSFIEEFIDKLYTLKLNSISEDMTVIFSAMNNKNQRELKFKISESGDIQASNHEFNDYVDYKKYNLSAGETQQMVLSFILALSKSAKINFPIIIDTPLGRLDKENRVGILNYFVQNVNSQQIILLSTDTEVVDDLFQVIKRNTADMYLLNFDGVNTSAIKNRYFGNTI